MYRHKKEKIQNEKIQIVPSGKGFSNLDRLAIYFYVLHYIHR